MGPDPPPLASLSQGPPRRKCRTSSRNYVNEMEDEIASFYTIQLRRWKVPFEGLALRAFRKAGGGVGQGGPYALRELGRGGPGAGKKCPNLTQVS